MGHGICQRVCPEVFKVDEHGLAWVIDDDPPRELYVKVREAVYRCPTKALLVDDG
jgi:ferredoxin